MHALMLADCCRQISALPPLVSSIDDLVAEIQKARGKQGPAQWIQGWGYDEGKLAEHRAPTRHDLDRGCSDAPVIIRRTCAHVCAVNSKALELALKITDQITRYDIPKTGHLHTPKPFQVVHDVAKAAQIMLDETIGHLKRED